MAINPTLVKESGESTYFPLPRANEVFILKRDGAKLCCSYPGKSFVISETAILTNQRIVVVKPTPTSSAPSSIELPFFLMSGTKKPYPEFEQPIFGANFLKGTIEPFSDQPKPLPKKCSWTLTFTKGQCSAFVKAFYSVFQTARKSNGTQVPDFYNTFLRTGVPQTGYYDAADPSVYYVAQPTMEAYRPEDNPYINPQHSTHDTDHTNAYLSRPTQYPMYQNAVPQPSYQPTSAPTYQASAPTYQASAPAYQASAPAYQASAPTYQYGQPVEVSMPHTTVQYGQVVSDENTQTSNLYDRNALNPTMPQQQEIPANFAPQSLNYTTYTRHY